MRRGTTPSYLLRIVGDDISEFKIVVTIEQEGKLFNLTGDRLDVSFDDETGDTLILFTLTQEETLNFKTGSASVQVRAINTDGYAVASNDGVISIRKILYEELIRYE